MAKRRSNKRQVGARGRGSGSTAKTGSRTDRGWEVGRGHAYPLTFRILVVDQVTKNGVTVAEAARIFGPSEGTIHQWLEAFAKGGLNALTPKLPKPPARRTKAGSEVNLQAVVQARQRHPERGP